ncbi:lipopolysaccharide kinase InaA family protein [uncultured Bacteroides sp.]|uniref:lipopolysaccharide kinase InaA family protein n=1 Tax=uncultured Bacteroides sp. TaxID=162156 RepID=UPI0026751D0A|nr:lipopolysaccharide kinase InaA family protein [uncultured Bacteroides sp.]
MTDYQINPKYRNLKECILSIPERFDKEGEIIYKGRNTLKIIVCGGIRMCVKAFKIPHFINKIAYAYLRKSKAERSFIYATRFHQLGINTPEPIAFILYQDNFGLTKSYYICRQLDYDFTFRGIINLPPMEQETVLREFVRFTYNFHQKGVYFIDHSPGNTLIRKENDGTFSFYLVDLNRTQFTKVSAPKGLKNLSNLEASHNMLHIMGEEYALLTHSDAKSTIQKLIQLTETHNKITERKSFIRNTRRKIKHLLTP